MTIQQGVVPKLLNADGTEFEIKLKPIAGFRYNIVFEARDVPHVVDGTKIGRIIVANDENSAVLQFKVMYPECPIVRVKLMGAAVRSETDIENFRE